MTALATTADLQAVMERSITDAEQARAIRLLEIASAAVRTYTGRTFTSTSETKRLRVRNGKVRLPQAPVTAVSAVADMNGNAVSFTWHAGQVVELGANPINWFEVEPYRNGLKWVDVSYTHGWTTIPADVVGIVCDIVAAALNFPAETGGMQSETLGDYTVTTSASTPGGGVKLAQRHRDMLAPYMTVGGTIAVA